MLKISSCGNSKQNIDGKWHRIAQWEYDENGNWDQEAYLRYDTDQIEKRFPGFMKRFREVQVAQLPPGETMSTILAKEFPEAMRDQVVQRLNFVQSHATRWNWSDKDHWSNRNSDGTPIQRSDQQS